MANLKVRWAFGGVTQVVGPVWRMTELPVGAMGKHGEITKYTSDWARIGYEKMSERSTMNNPRESGHEIEGRVTIKGKTYSAFTDGGTNPDGGSGMIIVRRSRPRVAGSKKRRGG
jgi:hypothetical protein